MAILNRLPRCQGEGTFPIIKSRKVYVDAFQNRCIQVQIDLYIQMVNLRRPEIVHGITQFLHHAHQVLNSRVQLEHAFKTLLNPHAV